MGSFLGLLLKNALIAAPIVGFSYLGMTSYMEGKPVADLLTVDHGLQIVGLVGALAIVFTLFDLLVRRKTPKQG